MTGETLLKYLAARARGKYHLHVWQWKPGQVGTHAPSSYHSQTYVDGVGKAFDAYSADWQHVPTGFLKKLVHGWRGARAYARMGRYARACQRAHGSNLTELIHNSPIPGFSASVKNGRPVPPSFWGAETWAEHRNHVHVAIA